MVIISLFSQCPGCQCNPHILCDNKQTYGIIISLSSRGGKITTIRLLDNQISMPTNWCISKGKGPCWTDLNVWQAATGLKSLDVIYGSEKEAGHLSAETSVFIAAFTIKCAPGNFEFWWSQIVEIAGDLRILFASIVNTLVKGAELPQVFIKYAPKPPILTLLKKQSTLNTDSLLICSFEFI